MFTNFYKNLSIIMKLNNLTQTELAKRLNVSQASVSEWCRGTSLPTLENFIKICLITATEPNVLLGWNIDELKSFGGQKFIDALVKIKR